MKLMPLGFLGLMTLAACSPVTESRTTGIEGARGARRHGPGRRRVADNTEVKPGEQTHSIGLSTRVTFSENVLNQSFVNAGDQADMP